MILPIFFYLFSDSNSKYVITGILIMYCSWCKILIATTKAREKKNTEHEFEEWLLQVKLFLCLLSRKFSKQVTQGDLPYPDMLCIREGQTVLFSTQHWILS